MKKQFKLEIFFNKEDSAHKLLTENLTVSDIRIIVCVLEQLKLEFMYDIIDSGEKIT